MFKIYFLLFLLTNLVSFIWAADNNSFSNTEIEQFKGYWYQGKAELTRYQLEQARYGEVHSGDAVLIFVTECFLPDKQVKHEHSQFNSTSVLKMNSSRKFFTGIYPYSILTSVFTPVAFNEEIHSLKVTSSTQEWCGQTYAQLNLRNGEYKGLLHSYFQNEADQHFELKASKLED